jgi:protein SCO1/2
MGGLRRLTPGLVATALILLAADTVAGGAGPVDARLDARQALERSEAAIGTRLGDHALVDSQGRPFSLADYRGRPLVISLVYSSCSSVCPTTTQRLLDAVADARRTFGARRFAVLSIGFDARNDTPKRMAAFAERQGIPVATWRVASGDETTLTAVLNDLGFSYLAAAGGFEHVTQTSIVDADGRVYRHVYGDDFPAQVFMEPLKELIFGVTTTFTAQGLVDRLRFLCTIYDPNRGRYRTSYAIAFGIGIGGLSLLIMGTILVRAFLRNRRLLAARG